MSDRRLWRGIETRREFQFHGDQVSRQFSLLGNVRAYLEMAVSGARTLEAVRIYSQIQNSLAPGQVVYVRLSDFEMGAGFKSISVWRENEARVTEIRDDSQLLRIEGPKTEICPIDPPPETSDFQVATMSGELKTVSTGASAERSELGLDKEGTGTNSQEADENSEKPAATEDSIKQPMDLPSSRTGVGSHNPTSIQMNPLP